MCSLNKCSYIHYTYVLYYTLFYIHIYLVTTTRRNIFTNFECVCTLHAIGIVHVKMYRYVQRIQLNCIHSCCCCCNFYFNVHFISLSFSFLFFLRYGQWPGFVYVDVCLCCSFMCDFLEIVFKFAS